MPTNEEFTGILQSRGQENGESYCVIDNTQYFIPDYVREWLAKLPDGTRVLYKYSMKKEGRKDLTKIRMAPAANNEQTKAYPEKLNMRVGVLISHYPTSCTIQTDNGEKTFALNSKFPPNIELPQKIEFAVNKLGFITGYKFLGKAEDVSVPQSPSQQPSSPPISSASSVSPQKGSEKKPELTEVGMCTLTIGGTINLQNYENLRVEISGPAAYRREMIEYLKDTLDLFGEKDKVTREMIEVWKRRVLLREGEE